MRVLFSTTVLFCSALLVGLAGCGKKDKDAIVYEVHPTEVLVLPPGESREAKVQRKGKDLKDLDLAITSSDPSVTVKGGKFKGDAKEAVVIVSAAKDAAPEKDHIITIKAGDQTKTLKVRVAKGGAVVDPMPMDPTKDTKIDADKKKKKDESDD